MQGLPGPCGCGCALSPETSLGFSVIAFAELMGLRPLPWQRWLYIHALETLPSGLFRYRTIIVLVARQNGKTSAVEIKNLWKLYVLGVMLVLGTAQTLEYAEESWDKAVEMVEGTPELWAEVAHVDKTNGKKTLRLKSGGRWKIATATRRGGRSLSADDVNLDELREQQSWDAWGAVTKTTMARPNGQVWAFSNAGDDKSIVLNTLQEMGRAAAEHPDKADQSVGHFEWSVPDRVRCDCGRPDRMHTPECMLADREYWRMANPALGYTITEEAIAAALNTDPEAIFRTEVLCQQVDTRVELWQTLTEPQWTMATDPWSEINGPLVMAVDVDPGRRWASIGVAGARPDGDLHVERAISAPGTGWVIPWIRSRVSKWQPARIVFDGNEALAVDAEATLADVLQPKKGPRVQGHTELIRCGATDNALAFGLIYDGLTRRDGDVITADDGTETPVRRVWHREDKDLTTAVAHGTVRTVGVSGRAWDCKDKPVDMTGLVSVTRALWGFASRPIEIIQPPVTVSPELRGAGSDFFRPQARLKL